MMNSVFGEIMENLRKHGDIDIEISVQESTFWCLNQIIIQKKNFPKNLLAIEMKKPQLIMNKPVYLGLLVLE